MFSWRNGCATLPLGLNPTQMCYISILQWKTRRSCPCLETLCEDAAGRECWIWSRKSIWCLRNRDELVPRSSIKTDISFWVKNCRCRQHANPLREANRSFSGNWRLIRSAILSYQFKWPGIDTLNFRISSTNETTLHEMGENISCIEGLMSTKSKDGGCIGCTLRIVPKKTLSK